jgi:hypothetical protein
MTKITAIETQIVMHMSSAAKARLTHAAFLEQISLKNFMRCHSLRAADRAIEQAERDAPLV